MGTGGPFSKRVQYSDGRIETILVPSWYDVGTVLAITHRKDGGVIAQRVGEDTPYSGVVFIFLGDVVSRDLITYNFFLKHKITSTYDNMLFLYTWICDSSGSPIKTSGSAITLTGTEDWTEKTIGNLTASNNGEAYLIIKPAHGMPAGDYMRLDLIKHVGSFDYGNLITDGSFESNNFINLSEMSPRPYYGYRNTLWAKNTGGKVRIIESDSYSGNYCLEFYK